MKFKTNATSPDSYLAVRNKIQEAFPNANLEFQLEVTDRVMHVNGIPENTAHATQIENAIKEAGFTGSWLTREEENR